MVKMYKSGSGSIGVRHLKQRFWICLDIFITIDMLLGAFSLLFIMNELETGRSYEGDMDN